MQIAARDGVLTPTSPLAALLMQLRAYIIANTTYVESLNSIIKVWSVRCPHMRLQLLCARLSTKAALLGGEQGLIAKDMRQRCVSAGKMFNEYLQISATSCYQNVKLAVQTSTIFSLELCDLPTAPPDADLVRSVARQHPKLYSFADGDVLSWAAKFHGEVTRGIDPDIQHAICFGTLRTGCTVYICLDKYYSRGSMLQCTVTADNGIEPYDPPDIVKSLHMLAAQHDACAARGQLTVKVHSIDWGHEAADSRILRHGTITKPGRLICTLVATGSRKRKRTSIELHHADVDVLEAIQTAIVPADVVVSDRHCDLAGDVAIETTHDTKADIENAFKFTQNPTAAAAAHILSTDMDDDTVRDEVPCIYYVRVCVCACVYLCMCVVLNLASWCFMRVYRAFGWVRRISKCIYFVSVVTGLERKHHWDACGYNAWSYL